MRGLPASSDCGLHVPHHWPLGLRRPWSCRVMLPMRIGVNGFGGIGRQVFRIAYGRPGIEVVHINDITEASALAPLLQFDTTHGRFGPRVQGEGGSFATTSSTARCAGSREPSLAAGARPRTSARRSAHGGFPARPRARSVLRTRRRHSWLASCAARRARYRGGWGCSTPSTAGRRAGYARGPCRAPRGICSGSAPHWSDPDSDGPFR